MEKKTAIRIPEAYLPLIEDIRLLSADKNNPNVTTLKQQEQIWRSLQKYGWAYQLSPTKKAFTLMERLGLRSARNTGEFFTPVLRLPVSDVDSRMLRQILYKLKGKHNSELDNEEYVRILQLGEKEDLKALLESVERGCHRNQMNEIFQLLFLKPMR